MTNSSPRPVRRFLTFANVCSLLALVIATSTGVSYAAVKIRSQNIVNGQVKTVDLAKNAVTTAKIKDGQVRGADLGAGSVNSGKVVDGSLAAVDILLGSLTGAQVSDGSLEQADLAPGSVGSSEIASDAVGATELQDNSVDGGEVVNDSLTANEIANNAVGAGELADNSVSGANVINDSLTFSDIQGGATGGNVSIGAGAVANGSCENVAVTVGGAAVGDAVVFSVQADMQNGVFFYGVRVSAADTVDALICNFSGGAMSAITNLPVRILTFR